MSIRELHCILLLFEPETCGGSRYVYYDIMMLCFHFYAFMMFCGYSGDFYDVWENFGEKGILVISENFHVFRVLRVFWIPK